jgi:hypothetical protein
VLQSADKFLCFSIFTLSFGILTLFACVHYYNYLLLTASFSCTLSCMQHEYYQWISYQCVTSYAGSLPIVLQHPPKSRTELAVFVTNKWSQLLNCKRRTKTGCIFEKLAFINVCISLAICPDPSMCFAEHISKVMKSTTERWLLSCEGINNYKLLQFLLLMDKFLHFLLLMASFHLNPRIITFSTLIN